MSAAASLHLTSLCLDGLLSFGPAQREVPVASLNVLIGPNASGKSNVIDALSLLAALPWDLARPVREGGGVDEWIWKGPREPDLAPGTAGLTAVVHQPDGAALRHALTFGSSNRQVHVLREQIENAIKSPTKSRLNIHYEMKDEIATFNVRDASGRLSRPRHLKREDLRLDQSVLAQRNDPDTYPEITRLRDFYGAFHFYREWTFGRGAPARRPQPTDSASRWLSSSADNLAMVLSGLQRWGAVWADIEDRIRRLHPRYEGLFFETLGNTIQLFVRERGLATATPATRLSDGTLRYLALLAVLKHPEPPPVIALEEPELGLHPDLLGDLADLLREASGRCQIFLTTHSDHLVSTLRADDVVVCDRDDQGTTLTRLDPEKLQWWLERYTLGALWRSGEIGGTRW